MRCTRHRMMRWSLLAFGALLLSAALPLPAQEAETETQEQRDARMAWWREARFGMFIHWGLYAVPAGTWEGKQIGGIGEWIMHHAKIPVADYAALTREFNPVKFDADEWVSLAKAAGMKYIIITSKHHDGFAMFDSDATDYNIHDATPFKRDPLKELAAACERRGIRLGFYYSQAQDWHHPGGAAAGGHWDPAQDGDMDAYVRDIAVPQVRELLTNYGKIAVLWWDTPVDMTREQADTLVPLLALQPGIITNNRLGVYPGDTDTPEQFIPATGMGDRDWETCMTINDTWGYKSYDSNWKPAATLVRNLIDIASKGGNYLLNVGPTAEGVIPEPSVERLKAVGEWMAVNGEAIYATTASPFRQLGFGRCTRKGDTLYLHVFDRPEDGRLVLPLSSKVAGAHLLVAPDQALAVENSEQGVTIALPETLPDPVATVVVVQLDGEPEVILVPVRQGEGGALKLSAVDAEIVGGGARLEGEGEPNVGYWTNASDYDTWNAEIQRPGVFEITAAIACEPGSEGSVYAVGIAEQSWWGKVESTKSWKDYTTVTLGTVHIAQAGKITVTVKPVRKPGMAVMNLRSVTLTPVEP